MSRRFHISVTVMVMSGALPGADRPCSGSRMRRFGEACKDFGLSVAYYFCELFGIDYSFTPTVTEYSGVLQWEILLPADFRRVHCFGGQLLFAAHRRRKLFGLLGGSRRRHARRGKGHCGGIALRHGC